jgi:hypothetical protein
MTQFVQFPLFLVGQPPLFRLGRLGQVLPALLRLGAGRLRGRLLRLGAEQLRLMPLLGLPELRLFAWFVHAWGISIRFTEIRKIIALLC